MFRRCAVKAGEEKWSALPGSAKTSTGHLDNFTSGNGLDMAVLQTKLKVNEDCH